MTKIARLSGDLKAFGSAATGTERTVFGDVAQSDTLDANINTDFLAGWEAGLDVNDFPPQQYFNAVSFTSTQLAAYLHQMGIAEYDAAQEYHIGSLANVSGNIYKSLANDNIGNAVTDITKWLLVSDPFSKVSIKGKYAGDLTAAIADIGSTETTLVIDQQVVLTADDTVPDNIALEFTRSGSFTASVPRILTWNGPIVAGLWQIIDSSNITLAGNPRIKHVLPEWRGALGDGSTDDADAIQLILEDAIAFAASITTDSGFTSTAKPGILFSAGRSYKMSSVGALSADEHELNIYSEGGTANIFSTGQTHNGFEFSRLWHNTFKNINFSGFDTAVKFDTNNVATSMVNFYNCGFFDNTIGVDSTSFALSRSTVLTFEKCKSADTPRLVNSYCDNLILNDCFFRNGADGQAFIIADSRVTVNGGIFTPYFTGAASRWFDLYESDTSFTRSAVFNNARFGKENGGIPVVYNYIDASKLTDNRQTNSILFFGGIAGSSGASTDEYVVVLTESGGESLAPSSIGFYGVDWSASNGLVGTESASAVSADVGQFNIYADDLSQGRLADENTLSSIPLVEAQLMEFFTYRLPGHDIRVVTTTGNFELDAGKERIVRFESASAGVVTDITTNVMDGTKIYMTFRNTNTTIKDATNGSVVHLAGNADFVGSARDALVIEWDRAESLWHEVSRSVN